MGSPPFLLVIFWAIIAIVVVLLKARCGILRALLSDVFSVKFSIGVVDVKNKNNFANGEDRLLQMNLIYCMFK